MSSLRKLNRNLRRWFRWSDKHYANTTMAPPGFLKAYNRWAREQNRRAAKKERGA